jgi:hypothetical protein
LTVDQDLVRGNCKNNATTYSITIFSAPLPPPCPPWHIFFEINHPLVQLLKVGLQLSAELLVLFNAWNCFRASKKTYLSKALCNQMVGVVETEYKWHRSVNAV